jgi:hypothetical protein
LSGSVPLWTRPALPERGPSLFGAAIDRDRASRVTEWYQWAGEVWATLTRLHRLLLRLAPVLPVERLAGLRRTLAEGELAAFVGDLAPLLAESGLALAATEVALLRGIPSQIEPLSAFHLAALENADPLWIATLEESPHTGGVRTAGVYDFADDAGVPRFAADHPRLPDPAECDRLAARMIAGEVVVRDPARAEDVIDPGRGRIVPEDFHTDGEWIWRASAAYYLAEYQLAPHQDLLEHLRRMERGAGS